MNTKDFTWRKGDLTIGDRVLFRTPNDSTPDSMTVGWNTVVAIGENWINIGDDQGKYQLIAPELIYTRRRGTDYMQREWCPKCGVYTLWTVNIVALVPIDHERYLRVGDTMCEACRDFKILFTARE